LVYALINFIGTIAVLKFIRYGDMGWPHALDDDADSEEPTDAA
jgi:multicomponent Na+:H+ antiporter subunit F